MSDQPSEAELAAAMDRIAIYAQEQMPTTTFVICAFTVVEQNGEKFSCDQIKINSEDRREVIGHAAQLMANFLVAPVDDRRVVN